MFFTQAMVQQGIWKEEDMSQHLKACSRHRARWTPPSTPDGFWDIRYLSSYAHHAFIYIYIIYSRISKFVCR